MLEEIKQGAETVVVTPDEVVRWSYLNGLEVRSVEEAKDYERLTKLMRMDVPIEEDARPSVDYDAITQWDELFEGKVLKDERHLVDGKPPFISLVMVVKNEAKTLKAAVESVRDVVDEVVIGIDDSCTDDTELVALELADVAFTFTWRNDFAWARNNAIRKATGKWIFILDGHEELEYASLPMVRIYTEASEGAGEDGKKKDYSVILACTVMNPKSDAVQGMMFMQPRLFKRLPKHFYRYNTHHQLAGTQDVAIYTPNIRIYHMMPFEREIARAQQRGSMNSLNLVQAIAREPSDERAIFYLANTYMDSGEFEAAFAWYKYHTEKGTNVPFRYHSFQQMASAVMEIGRGREEDQNAVLQEVATYLHEARKLCWFRAETLVSLGQLAETKGDLGEAEHWYKQAAAVQMPEGTAVFVQKRAYTWLPWKKLSEIYEEQQQWDKSLAAVERWMEYEPQDVEALSRWKMMEFRVRNRKKARGNQIVLFDSIGSFTSSIVEGLIAAGQDVELYKVFDTRYVRGADWAFFEWGDQNIIKATHHEIDPKIICRIHRYEPYAGLLGSINFHRVDQLVFTSEHIQRASNQAADIPESCEQHVVPSSVDVDRWSFAQRKEFSKNLAYVGYLNYKKGIPMLLQIMAALPVEYTLTVFGSWQTPEIEEYMMYMGERLGLMGRISWKGYQTDMDRVLDEAQIGQVINTSITEGCPYSLVEAMAKGIRPVVHSWPGAADIFSPTDVFSTVDEAVELITEGTIDSDYYRSNVEEKHNSRIELEKLMEIMEIEEAHGGEDSIEIPRKSDTSIVSR